MLLKKKNERKKNVCYYFRYTVNWCLKSKNKREKKRRQISMELLLKCDAIRESGLGYTIYAELGLYMRFVKVQNANEVCEVLIVMVIVKNMVSHNIKNS